MENSFPIRCLVLDDEFPATQLLASYVQRTPGLLLGLATTEVARALELLGQERVDLLFVDVQMPELTGLELLKRLDESSTQAVLTTAYPSYAFESYEYGVIDYLLKPIAYERFLEAVRKAKARLVVATASGPCAGHLFLKTEYRIERVDLASILYIEGLGDYLIFHTTEGRVLTLERMKTMEAKLPATCFVRVHKSYIINLRHVRRLEKGKLWISGKELPIGDVYRKEFMKRMAAP